MSTATEQKEPSLAEKFGFPTTPPDQLNDSNPKGEVLTMGMVQAEEQKQKANLTKQEENRETPAQEQKETPHPKEENQTVKEIRDAHKAARKEADELKAKLADFEGTKKQYEELKAQYEEAQKVIESKKKIESVAALEMSDEFQSKYVAGRQKFQDTLKLISEEGGIDHSELIAALSIPDRKEKITKLNELYGQLPEFLKDDLRSAVKGIEQLDIERKAELSEAEKAMQDRIQKRRSEESKQAQEKTSASREAWEEAVKKAKDYGLDDDQVKAAKEVYETNKDRKKAADILLKAHAFDKLQARNRELEEELAEFKGGTPGLGTGDRKQGAGNQTEESTIAGMLKRNGFESTGLFS